MRDNSNGYEGIAQSFLRARDRSIGADVVQAWAKRLDPGASILDIGCGFGIPITAALLQNEFQVHGVDASNSLLAEFRKRFPNTPVECNSVADSTFFDRSFDAVVAWGLLFLLPPSAQRDLIGKVARVLNPLGHFLFTSPQEVLTWKDAMTGLTSVSLGHQAYEDSLQAAGLTLVANEVDDGDNYYYFAKKC